MARVQPHFDRIYVEDILAETGWGLYYKLMVGIASACCFCQAMATLCLSFALPLASCDSELSENTLLTINTFFYFGKAMGGFVLNSLSDNFGKCWMIPNTLILLFGSCFLAAFSHGNSSLVLAAFLLGSGIEASARNVKIHLAEILPKNKRGCLLIIPEIFGTVGYISMSAFSWVVSRYSTVDHKSMDMRLAAWRIIFATTGGFTITVGCCTALLQPSPRFLLYKKKFDQALAILKQFYAINKSKYAENLQMSEQELIGLVEDFNINNNFEALSCTEHLHLMATRMFRATCILFKRRFLMTTVFLIVIKILLFFGTFSLNIWLAKVLYNYGKECYILGVDILHLKPKDQICTEHLDFDLVKIFLLLSLNILVAQITLMFLIDKIGRKIPMVMGLTASGCSSFLLATTDTSVLVKFIICSSIIIGYALTANTIDVVAIEVYPTALRGTAAGVINFYPSLLFCILYALLFLDCSKWFLFMGSLLTACIVMVFLTKDMKRQPMVE